MLTIFTLATTSCGHSDEPSSGSIIGTWKMDPEIADLFEEDIYFRFKKDGTGLTVSVTTKYDPSTGEKTEPEVDVKKFTYTVDGDKLTRIEDGETLTCEYKVSGNVLKLTFFVSATYTRVDPSELDQYLK